MERIFAIYDSDVFYTTRLMEYFNKKTVPGFDTLVFTKKDNLESFLSGHKVEILLLGEQLSLQDIFLNNVLNLFHFTEDKEYEDGTEEKLIKKYQPAQTMISDVLGKYYHKGKSSQTDNELESKKIITVFPPKPGAETLFYAWSVSIQLSYLFKTLFIPMELFQVPCLSITKQTGFYLSEFIFYLKENPARIIKIKDMLQHEGYLSYLAGIMHGFDLLSLTREDIRNMKELFSHLTNINTIVLYTAFYNEAVIEIMNVSDTVLVPIINSSYDKALSEEWKRQLEQSGVNTDTKKFCKVSLPAMEGQISFPFNLQSLVETPYWKAAGNVKIDGIKEAVCSN